MYSQVETDGDTPNKKGTGIFGMFQRPAQVFAMPMSNDLLFF
jgi:hypothetical protein